MKKVIRKSQYGFTKDKSCQTNITFYNKITSVDMGKEVDVVYLDFKKHSTLFPTAFSWTNCQDTYGMCGL